MKPHFPILDGLRGTAATLVVIYHLLGISFPVPSLNPMHHGYMAVDFFFLLSGFVVGYAYDDRWDKMSIWSFFKVRLIRLHPLVILGTILGALAFWFDPFLHFPEKSSLLKLLIVMFIGFTLFPGPRGWENTHPLDPPSWSLLQEYIANILYAVFVRHFNKIGLAALVLISGIVLTWVSVTHGDISGGWDYKTIGFAFIRIFYPFFGGLLLFRLGKLIHIPNAYLICSLGLILLFFMPRFSFNGIFDAACIIFVFPLIVAMGAGGELNQNWNKVCRFMGDISYPIYMIHYPCIFMYTNWIATCKPSQSLIIGVGIALFIFIMTFGYAVLKLYDEPVRSWLKGKFLKS